MKDNYRNYEVVSKNPIAYFWHWEGEIKKVRIVGCDFNKYIDMVCVDTGEEFHYKWGYVYKTYEDAVLGKKYSTELYDMEASQWLKESPDCIDPWKLLLSNRNYSMFKKLKRKEEKSATQWYVAVDNESYYNSKHFRTQKAALNYFGKLDGTKIEFAQIGEQNTYQTLIEFEDDQIWLVDYGYKVCPQGHKVRTLKSRHIGKVDTYKQWRK